MKNLYSVALPYCRKAIFTLVLFWSLQSNAQEMMRANLYAVSGGAESLVDGNLTNYGNYSNLIDMYDAWKLTNPGINFGIFRLNTNLVVERRSVYTTCDTTFFRMWNVPQGSYRIRLILKNLDHPGMYGYLKDNFLGTLTQVDLNGTTDVDFTVNATPASAAQMRFELLYSPVSTIDVNITGIAVQHKREGVYIDWKVLNEENIESYTVEHSSNGRQFSGITEVEAINTPVAKTYTYLDKRELKPANFYRVKALSTSGKIQYSPIARLNMFVSENRVSIYPNPVINKTAQLQFSNMEAGQYQVSLIHSNGVQQAITPVNVSEGFSNITLNLPQTLAPGVYQLQLTGPANTRIVKSIQIQ